MNDDDFGMDSAEDAQAKFLIPEENDDEPLPAPGAGPSSAPTRTPAAFSFDDPSDSDDDAPGPAAKPTPQKTGQPTATGAAMRKWGDKANPAIAAPPERKSPVRIVPLTGPGSEKMGKNGVPLARMVYYERRYDRWYVERKFMFRYQKQKCNADGPPKVKYYSTEIDALIGHDHWLLDMFTDAREARSRGLAFDRGYHQDDFIRARLEGTDPSLAWSIGPNTPFDDGTGGGEDEEGAEGEEGGPTAEEVLLGVPTDDPMDEDRPAPQERTIAAAAGKRKARKRALEVFQSEADDKAGKQIEEAEKEDAEDAEFYIDGFGKKRKRQKKTLGYAMPSANRVNKKDPTLIKADLPIYEGYQDADELAAAQEREFEALEALEMAAAVAAASGQVPGRQPSGPRAITLATHAQRHPIPMEQAADLVVQIPWPRSDVEAEINPIPFRGCQQYEYVRFTYLMKPRTGPYTPPPFNPRLGKHQTARGMPPKSEELVFRVPDMKRPEPAKEEEGGEAAGQEQAPVTLPA